MLNERLTTLEVMKKKSTSFLSGLKRSIEAKPLKSMAKLARSWNVSKMMISKAVWKDLKRKSYCRQRYCILTVKSKIIRIERSPLLLNHLKNHGGDVRILVDEKKIVIDEKTNCNLWMIAKSHKEVHAMMESKHSVLVMVFSAVVSDGRIMPPDFLKAGMKINTS